MGDLTLNRGNRQMQHFFVNGRTVRSVLLSEAVEMGYQGLLPVNRFPVCFIHVALDQSRLDVNIHPAKIQIRFQDEPAVRQAVFQMVREALLNRNLMPTVRYRQETSSSSKTAEVQQPVPITATASATPVTLHDRTATVPAAPVTPVAITAKPAAFPVTPPAKAATPAENPLPFPAPLAAERELAYLTGIPAATQQPSVAPSPPEPEAVLDPDPFSLLMKAEPTPLTLAPELSETYDRETLYDGLRIIGQVFRTYVLAERDNALYVIDQHAAHEKVLYEQFLSDWKRHAVTTQLLLMPEVLNADPATVMRSEDLKPALEQAGFAYEAFGVDALLVREVPLIGTTPLPPSLLKELLQDFARDLEMGKDLTDLRQEQIIRDSCKRAVKALDHLGTPELKSLLEQLKKLDSPYTCPHGRPIIIAIEKLELERRFKRS